MDRGRGVARAAPVWCGPRRSAGGRDASSSCGPSGLGQIDADAHRRPCSTASTSGVVTIDGEDVSHMEPNELAAVRNKRIGFVFQSFNLLSRTTAQRER